MAAARLRQHVNDLFIEVSRERTRWFQHLQSVNAEMNALQLSTKGQPATARVENLDVALTAFEARRQVLFDLKATDSEEISMKQSKQPPLQAQQ
jgi:hypothetical protein